MNGTKPGFPFRRTLQGVSAGATNEDLATDPIAAGVLWAVEAVTVQDANSIATRAQILVGRYGVERVIADSEALLAGVSVRLGDGFYVSDGERVIVRFVGTTAGDALSAVIEGEARYMAEPTVTVEVGG